MKYQSRFLAHPDGRIDPTGLTWGRLSSEQPGQLAGSQWSGDSSRWSQQKKLLSLEPIFRGKVQMVLDSLRRDGFKPHIVYGWRSVAVQQHLFDEGKSKVHFSFHNAQKADGTPRSYGADIIDERWGWKDEAKEKGFWTALSKEAKAQGLVWGGDWAGFSDVAHIQGRQNSELSAVKRESGL
jgi:peptidoglycan L-alanyl-D-glutamate endopeptidase CwlK